MSAIQQLIPYYVFLVAVLAWTLPWKAVALWRSAKSGSKWWFIAFLLVNTVGALEILYIFVFSKKKDGEVK